MIQNLFNRALHTNLGSQRFPFNSVELAVFEREDFNARGEPILSFPNASGCTPGYTHNITQRRQSACVRVSCDDQIQ